MLIVLAFAFGVAVVMAIYMGITKVPGMIMQRRLQGRLHAAVGAPEERGRRRRTLLVKVQHKGPMPAIDRMLGTTVRGSALGRWIDQSGMKASISGVLLIAAVLAVILGLLVAMLRAGAVGLPARRR